MHPLDPLGLEFAALAFIDRADAVLPTFSMASARMPADLLGRCWRRSMPTWAISFLVLMAIDMLESVIAIPRPLSIPAKLDRVDAGHDGPQPLVENGFGQHVPSWCRRRPRPLGLRGDLADHCGPPCFQ